jgi:formamidopyrimidine-DNA glycosylase
MALSATASQMTQILTRLLFTMMASASLSFHFSQRTAVYRHRAVLQPQGTKRLHATRRSTITMMPEGPEVRTLVDQLQPAVGMRLVDFRFVSGRYVRHGRPGGFEEFARTMTPAAAEMKQIQNGGGNNDGGGASSSSAAQQDGGDDDIGTSQHQVDIITSLKCKGKFIYMTLDHGNRIQNDANDTTTSETDSDYQRSIWITLGMTGQFVNQDAILKESSSNDSGNDEKDSTRWYIELMNTSTHQTRRIYYRDARNFGTLKFVLSANELRDKLESLGHDLLDVEGTTEAVFLDLMNNKSAQSKNICKFLMDQGKIAGIG